MLLLYLVIASVTVLIGTGIALVFWKKQAEFRLIFGFTAGAVLGFVLMLMVHLFTEVGYLTIVVMWGGFLLIWLLENLTHRMQERLGKHAETKTFPTPLPPLSRGRHHWSVNLTVIGLSIHSVMDGVNLSIAAEERTVGVALALIVLLHRLPVATVITTALRQVYGLGQTALWLTPLIITPFIGAFIGERLLHTVFKDLADYLFAFALGTLLHVVVDGLRGGHAPSVEKISPATKIAFVLGLIVTLCAMYFIPGFEHEPVH
ncbi:hypothetical protein C6501_13970 [Candidatus Poribacteria bacterium]|nr:MAG: hypothetical protein C6501_13970 [Candidatus Poribacteria bacterium]